MNQRRILIVEDNFDNMSLVRILLERADFEVLSAMNGEKGLAIARGEQPDLIVLDLDMPVLDGWDMLRALRADLSTEAIPVVVVTAHLMPDDRHTVLAAGGNGYIFKPFRIPDLLDEIQRCLQETAK